MYHPRLAVQHAPLTIGTSDGKALYLLLPFVLAANIYVAAVTDAAKSTKLVWTKAARKPALFKSLRTNDVGKPECIKEHLFGRVRWRDDDGTCLLHGQHV